MGKISDALKRVMEEREIQRQLEKSSPAVKVGVCDETGIDAVPGKEKTEFSIEDRIKIKERFATVKRGDCGFDSRMVAYNDSASPIADQYRNVRTNLKSYFKKKMSVRMGTTKMTAAPVMFAVTSTLHNEGKTLTAANLAITCAQDLESRVLLVDCDLRNGSVHKMFNTANEPGLSDLLLNDFDYSVALTPTLIRNLFVLPRGTTPENSSELMGSKRMRFLLEKLKEEPFTYIILDTPPLTPFSDAALVGTHTEGVVMVIQANRTQRNIVKRSKEFLENLHVNILGTVLNQVDMHEADMYSYYNYYYQHAARKQ